MDENVLIGARLDAEEVARRLHVSYWDEHRRDYHLAHAQVAFGSLTRAMEQIVALEDAK